MIHNTFCSREKGSDLNLDQCVVYHKYIQIGMHTVNNTR